VVQGDMLGVERLARGPFSGDRVEVTSGVESGDLVVTRGALMSKMGIKSNVTRINGEK